MEFNKPFIKLFLTNKKYYIYDVNRNMILNIDKEIYTILNNLLDTGSEKDINDYINSDSIKKLQNRGFLSSNKVKKIEHPSSELLSFYLDNNIKMVNLQVTQQCNFRCEYCVYSGGYLNRNHSNKKMSLDIALKSIDFIVNHSKNSNEISVGFYGGEPLLEFNFIKQCMEYAKDKAEGKKISFYITVNGSLLSDEIISYFYKHNVVLTISLDGPKDIHDSHRKFASGDFGTFDKVIKNVENIVNNYPEYAEHIFFNCVIDSKNDFTSIDKFFLNYETVKDINIISSLISDRNSKNSINISEEFNLKREYELFKIFTHLIRNNDLKNCSKIVNQEYSEIETFAKRLIPTRILPEKTHHSGPCIPGQQRLFINVDGNLYPCERVSEDSELMKIGSVDTGFDKEKIKNILNIGKLNEKQCKNCWALRFCDICAASIDDTKEFSAKIKAKCCKNAKFALEQKFKNYCVLKEFGHNFEEKELKAHILTKCH